ncbi:hypothetical protein LOTGIDRAFT_237670 [Lottia gigantea]|uniref:Protein rolling stone n=1 Tax=Lottia gigantea TaxID=225164 RepID=V4BBY1_LOTGI|nr:hypothetical protein LOTGIDRAFT_237670 [Lottia gigantea]ESP03572.1 hypothetical protein LOTGIDRAFT_237670 [Lottia gigantea]
MVNCELLREEFRVKKFGLCYDRPEDFYKPQFGSGKIYLVCRILWMVFNLSWIIASGCLNYNFASTEANRIKWFTFLTNWTYLLLTIHSIIMVIVVVYHQYYNKQVVYNQFYNKQVVVIYHQYYNKQVVVIYHQYYNKQEKEESSMPVHLKCIWILSNVVHGGSFIVTGTFWTVIFPGIKTLYLVTFVVHAFNSIYVLFNILASRIPIRILHCYQVMIYGLIYLLFTAIYQVSGGTGRRDEPSIYPVLNWNNPTKASILAVLMVCLGAPLMHLLVYLLYRCRLLLADKLNSRGRLEYEEKSSPESFDQSELQEIK